MTAKADCHSGLPQIQRDNLIPVIMNRNTTSNSILLSSASNVSALSGKSWTDDKRHRPLPSTAADDVQNLINRSNTPSKGAMLDHPLSNDRLMLKKEVLSYIPVSPKTWDRWMKDGTAPRHIRIGRQNFWKASDVHNWIESHS